nr:hypothetical protein [Planctomycetota bacterium]
RCHHVLVRGVSATGEPGSRGLPRLAFKANQCSHLYIEDCAFGGSTAYAFAYVAVQYGHILRSRFGPCGAAGICLKGGSAYHLVAENDVSSCRIMGIAIGEDTGFAYLISPWLQYEAYDIAVIGNTIRDSGGALCVSGGYGILMAHNTAYRAGSSRDTIVIAMAAHVWVGQPDSARQVCEKFHRADGWCSPSAQDSFIPCRNVTIINNLIYNPDGYESQFAHIGLSGPVAASPDSNIPNSAIMENIRIEGNLIWNGGPDKPVLDDVEHCYGLAARPTTSAPALRAINRLNTVRPILTDPDHGDFRPTGSGATLDAITLSIPLFDVEDTQRPPVPVDERVRSAAASLISAYRCIGARNPS